MEGVAHPAVVQVVLEVALEEILLELVVEFPCNKIVEEE